MVTKILQVDNGKVVPGIECYTVPELVAILGKYEDPIPALSYLWALIDPESPYQELDEDQKEEMILQDYKGEYDVVNDIEMIEAREKLELLYTTPVKRFYKANKILLDKFSRVAGVEEVTTGKEGNITQLQNQVLKSELLIKGFKASENAYKDELKVRGQVKTGYDEM